MATIQETITEKMSEERKSARVVFGGSLAEGIVGGGVIVLALIGLSNIMPSVLLPIAVIAMGAAFLLEGGAVSMRFAKLLGETSRGRLQEAEFGVGVTAEFLGGIAGVVLGVLGLLGVNPTILIPVAVIVFGSALIFGSAVTARLNALEIEDSSESARFGRIAHEAVSAAAGVEFLLGLSAVVLGVIALVGVYTWTLSMIAVLVVGITGFINGAAITARMAGLYRK